MHLQQHNAKRKRWLEGKGIAHSHASVPMAASWEELSSEANQLMAHRKCISVIRDRKHRHKQCKTPQDPYIAVMCAVIEHSS